MSEIKIIDGNLEPIGNLDMSNRPLFITIYDTKSSSKTIYEKDKEDKDNLKKKMFDGHYFISKDGKIFNARPCRALGEFAQSSDGKITLNDNNLGICLEGDFDIDIMGVVQKQSLINLIKYIKGIYTSINKIYFLRELIPETKTPGSLFPFNDILGDSNNTLVEDSITNLRGEIYYKFGSRKLEFKNNKKMNGNDIGYLQNILQLLGYKIDKTFIYDSFTMNVMIKFQKNNNLLSDGIVDEDDYILLEKLASELSIDRSDSFTRILYYDPENMISGKDIEKIQAKLIARGYNCNTTYFYDENTYNAVRNFQSDNSIPVDGKIGPITWSKILDYEANVSRTLYYTMPMLYGDDVTLLQQRLCVLGYVCPVSGYFDNLTEMQLKLLQSKNGLIVNGKLDEDTYKIIFK